MKNVIKKGSIIGVILGGMLIALMLIHSPIKIDLDISNIICGVVCGVLVCLTNCIITLSISKISPNYLYKKNNGQHGLLLNKTLICMLLVENVFAEELVFRSYLGSAELIFSHRQRVADVDPHSDDNNENPPDFGQGKTKFP